MCYDFNHNFKFLKPNMNKNGSFKSPKLLFEEEPDEEATYCKLSDRVGTYQGSSSNDETQSVPETNYDYLQPIMQNMVLNQPFSNSGLTLTLI